MGRKLLGGAVVLVALMVFAFMRRGEASQDVKAEMKQILAGLPVYSSNASYIDELFEKAHESAFHHSYSTGSRARRDTFDQNKYVHEVLTHMVERCRRDKEDAIGNALLELSDSTAAKPENTQ